MPPRAAPGQWKRWYWICFGGIIFFLLSIPLLRGRWTTADARRDEEEHEAMVEAELAAMQGLSRRPRAAQALALARQVSLARRVTP